MTAPSSLTMLVVTCHMKKFQNWTPSIGKVRIWTDTVLQGPTEDLLITDVGDTKLFDASGVCEFLLPASNDPQWTNFHYNVVITSNGKQFSGTFDLPYNGGPVDLADVLNLSTPAPIQNYILSSARGAPGGVASLGSDGFVPDSQLRYPILVLEVGQDPPPGTPSNTLIFHKTA